MEKTNNLEELLKYIDPAGLSYQDWVNVGMALKEEGYPMETWQNWSAADGERYDSGEFEDKWDSFRRHDVTGGTIVQMAKDRGWSPEPKLNVYMSGDKYSPTISWDSEYLKEPKFKEPDKWDPSKDLIRYLEAVFEPGDTIGYTMKSSRTEKGKYVPSGNGAYTHTAGELIDLLRAGEPIEKVFGTYNKAAGAWIRINPLDGGGVKDTNVSNYRNILIECDNLDLNEQIEKLEKIKIPISAMVYSGSKSIHAIIPVNAGSDAEYRFQFNFIRNIMHEAGMEIDKANINPSRLSRLPGVLRGEHKQFLIKTHIGMDSFQEWREWVSAKNDGLPDIVNLRDIWDNMPPLKPELIEGILRQGHKMIIASTSKAGKTFALMELAVKIAEGHKWLDHRCKQGKVLYVNMELDGSSFFHRFKDIYKALGLDFDNHTENVEIWNLRGADKTISELAPIIINRMRNKEYVAVMMDPLYKLMEGDENSNGDVAKMVAKFDRIAEETGAAVIYAHHFAKGSAAGKSVIDRASGAGTFARDPDAILTMTQLDWAPEIEAEQDWTAWRLESTLREFKAIKPVDMFFAWPIHRVDYEGRLEECDLLSAENNKRSKQKIKEQNNEIEQAIEICESVEFKGVTCYKRSNILKAIRHINPNFKEGSLESRLREAGYVTMKAVNNPGYWCDSEDFMELSLKP